MRVRAVQPGYYGSIYRDPTDTRYRDFDLTDEAHFSEVWMVKLGKAAPRAPEPAPDVTPQQAVDIVTTIQAAGDVRSSDADLGVGKPPVAISDIDTATVGIRRRRKPVSE